MADFSKKLDEWTKVTPMRVAVVTLGGIGIAGLLSLSRAPDNTEAEQNYITCVAKAVADGKVPGAQGMIFMSKVDTEMFPYSRTGLKTALENGELKENISSGFFYDAVLSVPGEKTASAFAAPAAPGCKPVGRFANPAPSGAN